MNNLPTPFLIKFILSFSLVQFSYLNTTLISERYQVSFLLEHQSLHSIFNFSVMIIIWKERYIPALLTFYCVTHALNPAWLVDFLLVGLFYCIFLALWFWPLVALACSGLKKGFFSWPEIKVGFQKWECSSLVTRALAHWQGPRPSAVQKRIPAKLESKEIGKVFIRRKKNTVHVDRHTGGFRERVMP